MGLQGRTISVAAAVFLVLGLANAVPVSKGQTVINTSGTTPLVATLTGTVGDKYGSQVGGSGTATITKVGTKISLDLTVNNLVGAMPPKAAYIRIGTGEFAERVVLGTPPGASWTRTGTQYRMVTAWDELEIFPRIPGFTVSEMYDFFAQESGSFYLNVVTSAFPEGAVKGNFAAQ